MAVQQRRNSKTRTAKRRTHYKLTAPALVKCPQCGALKRQHRVCGECGFYNGVKVAQFKTLIEAHEFSWVFIFFADKYAWFV